MLMLVLTGIGNADEHFPFLGEIKKGSVNVRAGANTNFEAVDKLPQGAEVVVLAQNFEWYKIQIPLTASAYIRADYIKDHGSNVGEAIGDKVNVRCKPKSESSAVGQIMRGETVKLIEKQGEWWKIEPPSSGTAWVHADFVQLKNQSAGSHMRKAIDRNVILEVQKPKVIEEPKVELITMTGVIERLDTAIDGKFHYQLAVDGKPVLFLLDAPHLGRFGSSPVSVEGIRVDEGKPLAYPVINIKKVSLIL